MILKLLVIIYDKSNVTDLFFYITYIEIKC